MIIVNYILYEMKYIDIFLTLRERVNVVKVLHSNAIFCLKLFLMQYRNYPKFVNMSIELSVYNFLPSNSVICIEFIFNVTIRLARVLIYDDINEIELKNLLLRLRG